MKLYYFSEQTLLELKVTVDAWLVGKDSTKVISSTFDQTGERYYLTIIYNG